MCDCEDPVSNLNPGQDTREDLGCDMTRRVTPAARAARTGRGEGARRAHDRRAQTRQSQGIRARPAYPAEGVRSVARPQRFFGADR